MMRKSAEADFLLKARCISATDIVCLNIFYVLINPQAENFYYGAELRNRISFT